jgi:hypothetical protein
MKTLREQIEELKITAYMAARSDVGTDHPNGVNSLDDTFNQLLSLIDSTVQEAIRDDEVVQWGMQINSDAIVHNQAKQEIRDRWEKLKGGE